MLEELKVLQSIIGDLSSVGLHIVLAYIAFRLVIIGAWCWFGYYIITKVYSFFRSDVSRIEFNKKIDDFKVINDALLDDKKSLQRRIDIIEEDHQREMKHKHQDLEIKLKEKDSEIEKVKHMYKILKEAKRVDSNAVTG